MKSCQLTNKKMNKEVYTLRRKVIDIIYMLKKSGVTLPRIEVRITDSHNEILGSGATDNRTAIWVTEQAVNMAPEMLMHIVCHEIGHTVFNLKHNDNCPLMAPYLHKPATLDEIIKVLDS